MEIYTRADYRKDQRKSRNIVFVSRNVAIRKNPVSSKLIYLGFAAAIVVTPFIAPHLIKSNSKSAPLATQNSTNQIVAQR